MYYFGTKCHTKFFLYRLSEENFLPDGTFAIALEPETQDEFEVVKDWDLSALEPQKSISLEKVKKHIEDHGDKSDFHVVAAHVEVTHGLNYACHQSCTSVVSLVISIRFLFFLEMQDRGASVDLRPHLDLR